MKKTLLALALVAIQIVVAQTVVTDNFTSYTPGNLSSIVDGTAPGQGNYYVDGGAASDYQIATIDAAHGNSLRITSGPGVLAADNRFVWKNFSTTATAGNNWVIGKYDLYTGAATGNGQVYCTIYSTVPIAAIIYDLATKKFIGAGRYTNASGVATFGSFGNIGANTYPANTWVTVTVSYNKTTGGFSFTTPEGTYTVSSVTAPAALIPNLTATEADLYVVNTTGNTVSNTVGFDNVNFAFASTATLNTGEAPKAASLQMTLYPNPVSDILNIKTEEKIKNISVFDISGKKVGVKIKGSEIDVRNLASGNYIITIETTSGITSEKFIKK